MTDEKREKPNIYNKGKIYAIRNYIDDDVYIGSTTQPLSKRFNEHKKKHKQNHCSIYKKILELGKEHFYIELVEHCPCENKEELLKREGHFIREMGTVNHQIMGRPAGEYQQNYIEQNKEYIKQRRQKYYEHNKNKINELCKSYRENNRDQINQKKKEYREANKEEIKQKASEQIQCSNCSSFVRRSGIAKHMKTDKCKSYIKTT